TVTAVEFREFTCQHLAARPPHGDRNSERGHVFYARHPDFPCRVLARDPAAFDQAPSLSTRVAALDVASDAPAQEQPVELLGELLRCRREADPDPARLLP